MEINPQSVIIPDAPLSNHTIRVDIQWSPASLPGWIMYYDLNCDQNNYSSASSITGTNTFSHTSLGYENYQIQFRFGSLDPNQPTITGTYQLYYDEQLIRSASFQAQKATYSSYAYFNTHYQSPVLTDYNFSIYASEICPGSYEDIYITTSRNCNATAEINTELDSITLTIETGREFVSFYKNSQKKDTVTFMFNELGNIYLMLDSTYTGSTPMDINIKSDWAGIIKYQQLIINPQEQFQIRVPDQPIIVFSGGVRGFKIETYSSGNCPPFISENLRYTALIKKGSNRGLLYDYDTGLSGDTLTNLTPQEDGEKYLDFITEGEILSQTDTVIVKVFTNDENIDTIEAAVIIYPNEIDVQIIPSVISQGDTARVVLKKRGVNGLEDFAPDKVFNVEIVQGLEFGLILDSLSNDTLTIFSNIPQGFKIIAKDSTELDSTRIRIKVSTEESGFPVARLIRNNIQTNKNEIVDDNEIQKSDDEIITPDWIIPGPILLEGFGDVVVKENECDEEIIICDNFNVQVFDTNSISVLQEYQTWEWIDRDGNMKSTNVGNACKFNQPSGCGSVEFGKTYILPKIGDYAPGQPIYNRLEDMKVKVCIDNRSPDKDFWQFNVENIRVPIFMDYCSEMPIVCGWVDLGDGTDATILSTYISDCASYRRVIDLVDWWWNGAYHNQANGVSPPYKAYFLAGVLPHENIHLNQLKTQIPLEMNGLYGLPAMETFKLEKTMTGAYSCPENALNQQEERIKELLNNALYSANNLHARMGTDPNTGQPWSEIYADQGARPMYDTIRQNIKNWAQNQPWWNSNDTDCGR